MKSTPIHFVKGESDVALCGFSLSARSQFTDKYKNMTCKSCLTVHMKNVGFNGYKPATHREERV
jgi:hypothetical protein